MSAALTVPTADRTEAAKRATYLAFVGAGFAFASWASRIPQVKQQLALSPSTLGVVLLAIACGSLVSLPLSGVIVARLGSTRTVMVMSLVVAAGLLEIAIGYSHGVVWLILGLVLLGFGNGGWDVGMNVQGADVERHLGRSIMSRFHAGFSIGTVGGALVGTAAIALGVSVEVHLILVAAIVAATIPPAVRTFLPDDEPAVVAPGSVPDKVRSAWFEPRTLLIGLVVLSFAFVEGTGNDWISVAFIDDHHSPATVGTLGLALFLLSMTTGRWFGPALLDRHGRVAVIRTLAVIGTVGLVLFAFGPTPIAFLGTLLWGLGASLGFPVGMSAGADDPTRAAARVSVIASVGYFAFLGGPPLIGFLGQHFTVAHGLISGAMLLALAASIVGVIKPLPVSAAAPTPR